MESSILALWTAADKGLTKKVRSLLKADDSIIDMITSSGETALVGAVKGGHVSTVQQLLSKGAKVNRRSIKNQDTPLHLAVNGGFDDVVQLLLAKGADMDAENSSGQTPADLASAPGKENVAVALR
ncbi:ankyrin repeat-containing domain protein, partial [Baffinella frigidus]